ncbi:MAG TPA: response regulator transcription factor [Stenotrophomonas sp.]
MTAIRIVVADDHPIVRSGVRSVVEGVDGIQVVGEASCPDSLIAELERTLHCDLVVTDLNMPGKHIVDGMPLLHLLRRRWPRLPVMVLTLMDNLGVLQLAMAAGARGMMLKSDPLADLPMAVRQIANGETYISASLREKWRAADEVAAGVPRTPLSPRESEVLRLFVQGMTVSQIAQYLHRSVKTVSRQKMSAMAKLRLTSDIEVYAYAREQGLMG